MPRTVLARVTGPDRAVDLTAWEHCALAANACHSIGCLPGTDYANYRLAQMAICDSFTPEREGPVLRYELQLDA
jgi:hypothetical protein